MSFCSPSGFFPLFLISQCFSGGFLYSQPVPSSAFLNPSYANVGDSITSLQVNIYQIPFDSQMTVRWNGVDRPTTIQAQPAGTTLSVPVYPSDLSAPGAAEIVIYSPNSGTVVGPVYFFVGIPVHPVFAVYDSLRACIWMSIGTGSGSFPSNSVVAVDPETGLPGTALAITASPTYLALSGDGHYLYVDTGTFVQQFDLTTLASVRQILTPSGSESGALAVMPGAPNTVAVVELIPNGSGGAVTIYDSGVARTKSGVGAGDATGLLFSSTGTTLFAGQECLPYCYSSIAQFAVGSTGLTAGAALTITGAPVAINGNVLYTTNGQAYDLTTGNRVADFGATGPAFFDPVLSRFFLLEAGYIEDGYGPSFVIAFDAVSQYPLGSVQTVSNLGVAFYPPPPQLVPFGADGVAFQSLTGYFMFHTGLRQPAPSFTSAGVINSASGASGAIAPGEIVSIYGTDIGTASPAAFQVARNGTMMPPSDVSVWFGDLAGTVIYESLNMINVMAPLGLPLSGTSSVEVVRNSISSAPVQIPLAASAPGLFQNPSGALIALNKDGTVNSAANPAHAGDYVILYGTGGGPTPGENPNLVALTAVPTPQPASATVGGKPATVLYSGSAPGLIAGAMQVNLLLPPGLTGAQPVVITVGGESSQQGVTVAIQ